MKNKYSCLAVGSSIDSCKPLFSVITINYNNASGLRKTIQSVLSQTIADYELVVIDGASSDGSKEFLEKMREQITLVVSEKDNGIYHAMNKGVKYAQGEFLIFMM